MKSIIKCVIVILILINSVHLFSQEIKYSSNSKLIRQMLFTDLGGACQTPDGMALDKKDNLYLAITKKASLKGMEIGPDGNIYLMDNQFFTRNENFSRLIRIIVQNGKPFGAEILVEGFNCGEAIRWYENRIYVTDAIFENRVESGIYSFSLDELNKKDIVLNRSNKK